jgi:hypothetical protein
VKIGPGNGVPRLNPTPISWSKRPRTC